MHDWFTAVSHVTPYVIRSRLNESSSASASSAHSSSADRNAKLAEIYIMSLALFFDEVRQHFDSAVGGTRPPSYLNRLYNNMAYETVRFVSNLRNENSDVALRAAVSVTHRSDEVLGIGFEEITHEITNLPRTEATHLQLVETESDDPNLTNNNAIVSAIPFGADQNASIILNAEEIQEGYFIDPNEPGELIPSRFEGEADEA